VITVRFKRTKALAVAITAAAAAGTIIVTALLPGAARGGAQSASGMHGTVPSPVPSTTVPAGVPTNVPPNATPPALTLEVATSGRYGPVLVTPGGITVYRPADGCACDPGYHPVLAPSGKGLRLPVLVHGQIGTVTRSDGSLQVTFNGSPLYTFSGDHIQGDTNGTGPHWRVIRGNP
jgi:predicted lipoprotein with Yx(FWY)xxD motif